MYNLHGKFKEFGEDNFPSNGKLKLIPEQERIHELEKKLRDIELEHEILKKSRGHLFSERSMIYGFIKDN